MATTDNSSAPVQSNAPDEVEWEDYDFLSLNFDSRAVIAATGVETSSGPNEATLPVDGALKSGQRGAREPEVSAPPPPPWIDEDFPDADISGWSASPVMCLDY